MIFRSVVYLYFCYLSEKSSLKGIFQNYKVSKRHIFCNMAYNLKSEEEVKEFIKNLGIEYRFGCYSEKKPEVCHLLGDYLEAISKDFQKAGKVYKTNCDDFGYGKSCLKYGSYVLIGRGGNKADFPTAFKYFDKGCSLNNPEACLHQGLMLITNNDKSGVPQDVVKGMSLLEKACIAQNSNACYYLSGMYISGVKPNQSDQKPSAVEYVVAKDMKKAFKFALEGCNLGNMYSCANLSQMYSKGDGVVKNEELANKYKEIALEIQKELQETKTLKFQEGLS